MNLQTYDTVRLKAERLTGTVERTFHDLGTHFPLSDTLIISHVPVDFEALEKFLASGKPPLGYVYVRFSTEAQGNSLVAESDLELLNRRLNIGDNVKKNADDTQVGTVVDVEDYFYLSPIANISDSRALTFTDDIDGPYMKIPGHDLRRSEDYYPGDYIVYDDWIGQVEDLELTVVLKVESGVVVVDRSWELELIVPDLQKPIVALPEVQEIRRPDVLATHMGGIMSISTSSFEKGQFVITNRRNLQDGRWLEGKYDAGCIPQGRILDVKTRDIAVQWLCPNAFADESNGGTTPENTLRVYDNSSTFKKERELRPIKKIRLYDRDVRPSLRFSVDQQNRRSFGQEFEAGDLVKFRDQGAAVAKYASKKSDGDHAMAFSKIERSESYGFDLNEFRVLSGFSTVTVLWQDGSTTTQQSTQLIPHSSYEVEIHPGDIVSHKEGMRQIAIGIPDAISRIYNETQFEQGYFDLLPQKIGIVQSVDSAERLLKVRWYRDASNVKLCNTGACLQGGTKLGNLCEVEEISEYEIMTHDGLSRRRRDIVVILPRHPSDVAMENIWADTSLEHIERGPTTLSMLRSYPRSELFRSMRLTVKSLHEQSRFNVPGVELRGERPLDWVGQILDVRLDGTLIVRLNAVEPVRDIIISVDDVIMVIDDGVYDVDGDPSVSDSFNDVEMADQFDMPGGYYSDDAIDETVEYEGGERMDQDSESAWDTDDETPRTSKLASECEDSAKSNLDHRDTQHRQDDNHVSSKAVETDHLEHSENAEATTVKPLLENTKAQHSKTWTTLSELIPIPIPVSKPAAFEILSTTPPQDQFLSNAIAPEANSRFLSRIRKEHKTLASLPPDIYVRSYESRLDILRCLIIGPVNTPYENAPFMVDLQLGSKFPKEPPTANFHSWTGGLGRINPNLYEEGKICLSLLGTWSGHEGENWSEKSSILQLLVSLQAIVLVSNPFFNEAGFENFVEKGNDKQVYEVESLQYSEKAYVMARGFVRHAVENPPAGMVDVIAWNYLRNLDHQNTATEEKCLLDVVTDRALSLIEMSEAVSKGSTTLVDGKGHQGSKVDVFLRPLSKGAIIMLRKHLNVHLRVRPNVLEDVLQRMTTTITER